MNKKLLDLTVREAITLVTGYAVILLGIMLILGADSIVNAIFS